jgi:ACS family glucarate transporter-like MFS transporter
LCFTVAIFGADVTVGPSWVVCTDIGGTKTGRISSIMNLLGGVGAFLSANAYPILHQLTGGYSSYFIVAAVLDLLAIGCWIAVSSLRVADVNRSIAA